MGTIKTTNIEPIADNGTVTLGSSGDTFTVPSGVTVNMSSATQTGVGGTNTPAFEAYLGGSGGQALSNDTITKVQFDTELYDTNNTYDSSTNYRFTPAVAGKYFIYSTLLYETGSNDNLGNSYIYVRVNGSSILELERIPNTHYGRMNYAQANLVADLDDDDYVEIYARVNTVSGSGQLLESNTQYKRATKFGAYRIII